MIKKYLRWQADHLLGLLTSVVIVGFASVLFTHFRAHAATSYLVANEPQMFLDVNMTTTQTAGIVLATPQLNGSNYLFSTTSGGVLRVRQGTKREDISYASATVNTTTLKVTLAGVVRNICPHLFKTYVTCGDGQQFSRGAIVELNQDARLFNLKLASDRPNTATASGALTFSGSGSLTPPLFNTVAQRNQQLGSSPSIGKIACVSATNLCYFSNGGSWISFGSGSNAVAASEIVQGTVQLGTVKDQSGGTITGSTGAPTIVQTQYLTASGGYGMRGRVVILNNSGRLAISLGGTQTGSLALSGILVGRGARNAPQFILPGGSGSALVSLMGNNWGSHSLFGNKGFIGLGQGGTGSGGYAMSGVLVGMGPLNPPVYVKATGSGNVLTVCMGTRWCVYPLPPAVVQPNASLIAKGFVQLGTIGDLSGATINGSSGAPTVVRTQYVTASGGLSQRGKVTILNGSGYLAISLGGTQTGSLALSGVLIGRGARNAPQFVLPGSSGSVLMSLNGTNWKSHALLNANNFIPIGMGGTATGSLVNNGVLIGQGASPPRFISPGASGSALISINGTSWGTRPVMQVKEIFASTALGSATTNTAEAPNTFSSFAGSGSFAANALKVGDVFTEDGQFEQAGGGGNTDTVKTYIGGTALFSVASITTVPGEFHVRCQVEAIGASGSIRCGQVMNTTSMAAFSGLPSSASSGVATIDTTKAINLMITSTNTVNNASGWLQFRYLHISWMRNAGF